MAIEIPSPTAAPTPAPTLAGALRLLQWRSGRVGVRERMLFTERLALLLETGVSLHAGLKSLREQTDDPRLARIIAALCDEILQGSPLSAALRHHPQMFPATYVNLVAAAEDGGFLPQVLQQLIDMDEKAERLRSTLFAALSYPAFLVFFSLATIVFVLVGVFPKFTEMFERIRADLPLSTLVLMAVSDFLRQHWAWVLGGCAVLLAGVVSWLQQPAARGAIDGLKLRIPLVSELFVQIYLTQTLRVMGLSLANGVPVVDALQACQDLVRNSVFARFIDTLRLQVTEGRGIAHGFEETAFIPPLVRQMIRTGEDTGNLAKVMTRVADFYDRELTKRITVLSKLAEPVMLLIMGAVVGVIVSSLILPIFKLSRAVH